MYYIHWKSLICYGFVFWITLCITDLFGQPNYSLRIQDLDPIEIFESNALMQKIFNERLEQELAKHVHSIVQKGPGMDDSVNYWSMFKKVLLFVFLAGVGVIAKTLKGVWIKYRKSQLKVSSDLEVGLRNKEDKSSKIPVLLYSKCPASTRASDPNIKHRSMNSSCSDFDGSNVKSSQSLHEQQNACDMIFKNDNFNWQNHCARLREEMLKAQAVSLKEHANLSRKLEAISKEKKELAKLLAIAQKENNAAKNQIEELMEEKAMLLKRLENATKEFRMNTKSKKQALAKLDELTSNVDVLKMQLEQVTRDKEIVQNKFNVLEEEYIKLQDRLIESKNNKESNSNNRIEGELPERDNGANCEHLDNEADMKKIESKIKELEKNLENFSLHKLSSPNISLESDLSITSINNTDTDRDLVETTDKDSMQSSPRFMSWRGKAGDMSITNRVNDKVRMLELIRQRAENFTSAFDEGPLTEPRRIVSSSAAFQNFLKCLRSETTTTK